MRHLPLEYPTGDNVGTWTDWAATAGYSGFRVGDPGGRVELAQVSDRDFVVSTTFAFIDPPTITAYCQRLIDTGVDPTAAAMMLEEARTWMAGEERTDLASVPRFMAWFEGPYGRHTLAAILHDDLIRDAPNTGALASDTLADSLFRDMMGVAGVPLFKRWLMWAAVAARTRWFATTIRRVSLIIWAVLALLGITVAGVSLVALVADLGTWDRPWPLLAVAAGLPVVASVLWGRQYGAGLVAAAAGLWLIPAAVFVLVGLAIYNLIEWFTGSILNYNRRQPPPTVLLPAVDERAPTASI